ncbi:TPA: spermidine synthase [Legionella pneumophila]|uniref:fused MFS/spermidine synthase n=1 Tax=Legionella pneumophila TaxID=446 RepID=UPI000786C67D|nr:fused MFS/spermidine synthase [Legionella pneumophila]HAT3857432.1 spermidine synthase [Legionella pneumophila]HAT3866938.1 spermidine synthase [Legionella pneumophila]HAT3877813.1 spermidine synthase [Legionella pneumophila]HAT3973740.1 spermidine synthase [Legionella pneumophila]HAT5007685.1 spermidine synthase [Legionella pneumophila]
MFRFLFPVSLFISSILLFSIQPMVAKAILPIYGGTPGVWTVCVLFFQFILLIAYGYVWLISQIKKPAVWRLIHMVLVVLSFTALPLLFHPAARDGQPEWVILHNLLIQLGLPLLVIGASAPLLQFAYSQTTSKGASDPYYLYISSNLGSLSALLFYPWVIERFIGLTRQFYLWNFGFAIYLLLLVTVLFFTKYQPLILTEKKEVDFLPWREIAYWIFLSFVPCSLMLGVTLYITTDVAATPLFWVLPLALYLLSFVFTFTATPLISQKWISRNCLFFLVFTILGFIFGVSQIRVWQLVLFNLLSFFILALLCHGQLFARRPKPHKLTLFYFCLSIGGVLAGIFNGILAPNWFNYVYEYPLAILLSLFALQLPKTNRGWWVPLVVLGLLSLHYFIPTVPWFKSTTTFHILAILALGIIVIWHRNKINLVLSMLILFVFLYFPPLQDKQILLKERNFYGVKQVFKKDDVHALISQSTLHGMQVMNGEKASYGRSSYYGAIAPIVDILKKEFHPLSATIMGLGAGTLLCQFRATDSIKVIEIDQQVIDLAKNNKLFTYIRDCSPSAEIIKQDGRLALVNMPDASQDLLILDAFNSDAIPVHLMTLEAFTLYKKKIVEDGVILVNLSNRHLQMLPVINAIGRSLDMITLFLAYKGDKKLGQFNSEWAMLTSNQSLAFQVMKGTNWKFVADDNQFLWTDDYSNIIPLLKW